MIAKFFKILRNTILVLIALILSVYNALAMPALKANVVVNTSIVTVADLFDNAGELAETAIFRAPAPGTAGEVSIEMVRLAADRIGLRDFETYGLSTINVARDGTLIGQDMIDAAIRQTLVNDGTLRNGMDVTTEIATRLPALYAAASDQPIIIDQFRFYPANSNFSARILISGQSDALNVQGRLYFTVEAPHLTRSLPSGSVIQPTDVEMRAISAQLADAAGVPRLEDLIGMQLNRQMRDGVLIRTADVGDPQVVARNDIVTLFLQRGAMTLTVRGQALNSASRGENVSVLNLVSNRVVNGIAVDPGTVQVISGAAAVASL